MRALASPLTSPLLALVALASANACLLDVPLGEKHCNEQHPCISGYVCVDTLCANVVGEGEGGAAEGEGSAAEGEGSVGEGEGEGSVGEGEGSVAEGEGEGSVGEGEGSAGEGEGSAGEGEGEGDGSCGAPFVLVLGSASGDTSGHGADLDGTCAGGSDDDVVYRYVPPVNQTLVLNLSTPFDAVIYVRDVCDVADSELACGDNASAGRPEHLEVDVAAGEAVSVVVDGFQSGTYTLNASAINSLCGDGRLNLRFEQCEDGNLDDTDTCSATCNFNFDVEETEPNDDGSVHAENGNCFTPNDIDAAGRANADTHGAFTSSVRVHGAIAPIGDEDAFPIMNTSAAPVDVRLTTHGRLDPCDPGGPLAQDTFLVVQDNAGTTIDFNDDIGGSAPFNQCSTLTVTIPPGTTYYAIVGECSESRGIDEYVLEVTFL